MSTLIIEGGHPLKGTVTPMPNKNAILPLIPAAVLTDKPIIFSNVPKSSSVRVMLRTFKQLGGKVSYLRGERVKLDASGIKRHVIDKELAKKERASIMFLGPLLARLGQAELGDAGGCKLGNRPVDTLIQGLRDLGAVCDRDNIYKLSTKQLKGNESIWLLEASVTGTENLIMAATLAKGTTVIYNAACEPHVQDLCNFLVTIGAQIEGISTNKLTITGVDKLHGGEWSIIPDQIDIGGLIAAAGITGGELTIKDAIPQHMYQIIEHFSKLGLQVEIQGSNLFVHGGQELSCKPNLKGDTDKIAAQPWPGFPADLIPQVLVLAAKAKGSIVVQNMMYESGLYFVEELKKLRANVMLTDPHQVITLGPSRYKGAVISAPPVLQSAHAVALAALAAEGTTKLLNADIISRRYPQFIDTFRSLGAKISLDR